MPKATCTYEEVEFTDPYIEGGEQYPWSMDVLPPCERIADHKLTLKVEGLAEHTVQNLCCQHRKATIDEIQHGGALGVSVLYDQLLDPSFSCQVIAMQGGYAYEVTVRTCNGSHTMPKVMLEATTPDEAWAEAAEKVERLERITRGEEP